MNIDTMPYQLTNTRIIQMTTQMILTMIGLFISSYVSFNLMKTHTKE